MRAFLPFDSPLGKRWLEEDRETGILCAVYMHRRDELGGYVSSELIGREPGFLEGNPEVEMRP